MPLGDFIHQKLSAGKLPATDSLALSEKLPLILSPFLKTEDTNTLTKSVSDYLCTEEFSSTVSENVGEPEPNESEDEFVSRAKSAITDILNKRFNQAT